MSTQKNQLEENLDRQVLVLVSKNLIAFLKKFKRALGKRKWRKTI